MLNNHCGSNRKLTNLQEASAKASNNQINAAQLNNHDNISLDNSDIQSLNNTLSAAAATAAATTIDEKQKLLLLKIANNSMATTAGSAVASGADNDYGNVSSTFLLTRDCCVCVCS